MAFGQISMAFPDTVLPWFIHLTVCLCSSSAPTNTATFPTLFEEALLSATSVVKFCFLILSLMWLPVDLCFCFPSCFHPAFHQLPLEGCQLTLLHKLLPSCQPAATLLLFLDHKKQIICSKNIAPLSTCIYIPLLQTSFHVQQQKSQLSSMHVSSCHFR